MLNRLDHAVKWAKHRRIERRSTIGKIYIIQSGEYTKVGIARMVGHRLSGLQVGNPIEIQLLASWESNKAELEEHRIHHHLRQWHVRGEWFKLPYDVLEGLLGI